MSKAFQRIRGLQEIGVLVALIVLMIALWLTTTSFLTAQNLLQVARQASYYGIMAVGMVWVISMGDIDLSVGSILTLTNVVTAMALRGGVPVPIALLIGLATGAVCGFLNGVLAVWLRIPMIIVTLGTLSIYRGIALVLCSAAAISQFSKDNLFFTVGGGNIFGVPTSVLVMLIAGVVGWWVLTRSVAGRHTEAIGGNPVASYLAGIPLDRYRIGVMTLNGTIAALAGIIALAFLQSADPSNGVGYELWVIASVIIGGTALSGGQGSVPGAILGALIIAVIRNGLVLLGASTYAGTAVTGAVIILAVAIDSLVKRRAVRRK
ncbi:monosaccharide-transporting ATPase [Armatimonadota bacterium]|nr:monosaccharide-transporting ATPase [Armatimonadota bacterium]